VFHGVREGGGSFEVAALSLDVAGLVESSLKLMGDALGVKTEGGEGGWVSTMSNEMAACSVGGLAAQARGSASSSGMRLSR
jgi:hypothetical protein